jgi:hypothetical protein
MMGVAPASGMYKATRCAHIRSPLNPTHSQYNPFMGTLDPSMYEAKNAELEQWFVDHPAPIQKAAAAAAAAAESEANAAGNAEGEEKADANSDGENSEGEEGNDSGSEDEEGDVEDVEEEDEEMAILRANMVRAYRPGFKGSGVCNL